MSVQPPPVINAAVDRVDHVDRGDHIVRRDDERAIGDRAKRFARPARGAGGSTA